MNRRWIGVVASIALALLGAFLLVQYIQGADERALEGEETVEVLVASTDVPRGTAAEDLAGSVETVLVPAKLQTPGSVGDLAALEGTYTSVDLVAGEQLLAGRFVAADTLVTLDEFPLPAGMLEVTISLSPERALGGAVRPGEEVALVASFNPFNFLEQQNPEEIVEISVAEDGTVTETTSSGDVTSVRTTTPASTHLIIPRALVSNVQVEQRATSSSRDNSTEDSTVNLAPTGNLLISLALDPEDVERTVFTAEFGNLWLARASEVTLEGTTPIQTRATVYEDADGSLDQASVK
jgi:pilus assembly protein CpaB